MHVKLDNPVLEAFEELGTLNETYQSKFLHTSPEESKEAESLFLDASRTGALDVENFHKAFDTELEQLDLLSLFDANGKLLYKGTWGEIKEADKTNPAVQALRKFWAWQFVDRLKANVDLSATLEPEPEQTTTLGTATQLADELTARLPLEVDQDVLAKYKELINPNPVLKIDAVEKTHRFNPEVEIRLVLRKFNGSAEYYTSVTVDKGETLINLATEKLQDAVDYEEQKRKDEKLPYLNFVNSLRQKAEILVILEDENQNTYLDSYTSYGHKILDITRKLLPNMPLNPAYTEYDQILKKELNLVKAGAKELPELPDPENLKVVGTVVSTLNKGLSRTYSDELTRHSYSWSGSATPMVRAFFSYTTYMKDGIYPNGWGEVEYITYDKPATSEFYENGMNHWKQITYISYATD